MKFSSNVTLHIELILKTGERVMNVKKITVSPVKTIETNSLIIMANYVPDSCSSQLEKQGFKLTSNLSEADFIITTNYTKDIENAYLQGTDVLFLAENGDKISSKGQYIFRELDSGESWNRTSSMNYVNTDYFKPIPLQKEMGWEFEGLYPNYVIPMTNYEKLGGSVGRVVYMFGNHSLPNTSRILSGYFQGWGGQVGASMIQHKTANSTLTLTTWKLVSAYGTQPIATQIVNHIIKATSKQSITVRRLYTALLYLL